VNFWKKVKRYPKIGLVLLAYVAFIALGLPDGLLGVAWPSIRASFGIPLDAVGMLITASVAGYITSSFLSGPVIARIGVAHVLTGSCALTGMGLMGYTLAPEWWMMVVLGVISGLGAGAIDAGLNTYVAAHFGEGLMQWLHASYGIGVTLGPIIMTVALANLNSWRTGYQVVAGFQWILAVGFAVTLAMWEQKSAPEASQAPKRLTDYRTPMRETLRHPRVWFSALLFFLYVGAEVSLGTWTYSLLIGSRGIDPTVGGLFTGSYWAAFTVGRVVAGLFARKTGGKLLVLGGLAIALLGTVILIWNPSPPANLLAVALIGLAIGPIFPAMMSGTSQRVGMKDAANTIGLQMAATGLGTAVVPSLMGVLARQVSLEVIPICQAAVFAGLLGLSLLSARATGRLH
jgi:fucose permease